MVVVLVIGDRSASLLVSLPDNWGQISLPAGQPQSARQIIGDRLTWHASCLPTRLACFLLASQAGMLLASLPAWHGSCLPMHQVGAAPFWCGTKLVHAPSRCTAPFNEACTQFGSHRGGPAGGPNSGQVFAISTPKKAFLNFFYIFCGFSDQIRLQAACSLTVNPNFLAFMRPVACCAGYLPHES